MGTHTHGRNAQIRYEQFLDGQEKRASEVFFRDIPGVVAEIAKFIKDAPHAVTVNPTWDTKTLPEARTLYAQIQAAIKIRDRQAASAALSNLIHAINSWQLRRRVELVLRTEADPRYYGNASIPARYYLEQRPLSETTLPSSNWVEEEVQGGNVVATISGNKRIVLKLEIEYMVKFNPIHYNTRRTGYIERENEQVEVKITRTMGADELEALGSPAPDAPAPDAPVPPATEPQEKATLREQADGNDVIAKIKGPKALALAEEAKYKERFHPAGYGTHRTHYVESRGWVEIHLVRYASTGD